jgi:hypothetical protein
MDVNIRFRDDRFSWTGHSNVFIRNKILKPMYYYENFTNHITNSTNEFIYSIIDSKPVINLGGVSIKLDYQTSSYIQSSIGNNTNIIVTPIDIPGHMWEMLIDIGLILFIGFSFYNRFNWLVRKLKDRNRFVKLYNEPEQIDCTICLENIERGRKASALECKHIFHTKCINKWLEQTKRCPNCNDVVT